MVPNMIKRVVRAGSYAGIIIGAGGGMYGLVLLFVGEWASR